MRVASSAWIVGGVPRSSPPLSTRLHFERGSGRAQRIVLVHNRKPENCHYLIPNELLDPAAVTCHHLCHLVEEAGHELMNRVRIKPIVERGKAAYIENRIVSVLRAISLGGGDVVSDAPQAGQKRAPSVTNWPHDAHQAMAPSLRQAG
jgi:hypothetical protein